MSALFTSFHPSLFSPTKPILRPKKSHSLSFLPKHPTLLSFPRKKLPPVNTSPADEWGEKSDPDPQPPSKPDPPQNEDEWGSEPSTPKVTDEWGDKSDPEEEAESGSDPVADDDEWGKEDQPPGNGRVPEVDKLGELKRCLVDSFYGTEYGFSTTAEVRAEISELVSQLEAENPYPKPNDMSGLLDGSWVLLYTAFSELLPLVAVGSTPLLKIKKISQEINTRTATIVNATTLSSPFATFSFSATATFEIRSPSRIQVRFKEGAFNPPEISSTVNLPEKLEIFGQKIDLLPVQQSLNPLQDAFARISRAISGQPPLKVQIPGNNRSESWLLTTYLDEDFRISRGDGGLFVLAKEGSPLLDQLS